MSRSSLNNFNEFSLPDSIQRALNALQFQKPTPIQSKAIPVALSGKDFIATAQTGTGKTAAFCIPALVSLLKNPQSVGLVIAPTRELAIQIDEFWKQLTRYTPQMGSVSIIGGASFSIQMKVLSRKPRLMIATPGRLVDHLKQRTVNLSAVSILVLDEADRMMDMGFAPQLSQILKFLPPKRQTLLFSATWENNLNQLSKKYLTQPERIAVGQISQAAKSVNQAIIQTTVKEKNETLLDVLNQRDGSVLIFARTQHRTDRLAKYLNSFGLNVGRIHGGRTQGQRNSALTAFKKGQTRVLVATDIAARGIDVQDIAHVINYDLPQVSEDYVHRIGRTGRAGAQGQALSLLTPEDRAQWREISQYLRKSGSHVPQFQTTQRV